PRGTRVRRRRAHERRHLHVRRRGRPRRPARQGGRPDLPVPGQPGGAAVTVGKDSLMRNLAILIVLLWSTAAGAVPNTINFTGRLSTSTGAVTGSVDITLRLFPAADGGTAL